MKSFAALFAALDATTSNLAKHDALVNYFVAANAEDAAWAAYFLAGGKQRQLVPTRALAELAGELAHLPEWLLEESYHAVGDLAETVAHILPPPTRQSDFGLAYWIEQRLLPLRGLDKTLLKLRLTEYWDELDWNGRFLLVKLIGGSFRVGVARQSVVRALAQIAGIDHKRLAQRMVGWTDSRQAPTAARYLRLVSVKDTLDAGDLGLPYPFFLAHPLQQPPATLGPIEAWQAEWKWDGIRGQIVKRGGTVWLWSRGEDLITERFPEIVEAAQALPDGTVLDGEILAWPTDAVAPLSFAKLQPRITRKTLTRKILADAPAAFVAYDALELDGIDLRGQPLAERGARLDGLLQQSVQLVPNGALRRSPLLEAQSWEALDALQAESRARGVEGLMLKQRSAAYGVGRTKAVGLWWKWKLEPRTVDAVLLYAQRGHGRRASLYTDFTFAVWDQPGPGERTLVPFAKAYSGLTDDEMRQVDAIVRKTTIDKFGPVRSVTPTLVFEIGFEGIQASPRHKSGIAVRFPRMLRWRTDKHIDDADTLLSLREFLHETPR